MSVNTQVKDGRISNLNSEVQIVDIEKLAKIGEVHYNPGLARDNNGNTWVAIRSCVHNPGRFKGYQHPVHYQNYLHVGKFDEETFNITKLKEIKPEKNYPGFQWGVEDVRLFWREDGLHGIGVILPITSNGPKANQAEILIDHEKGTYKLLRDYGHPMGTMEKNWTPPETPQNFDFIYSPTQIVKDGKIFGEPNDLFLHGGTPLIEYEDGFLSLMHMVVGVKSLRTYVTVAAKWNKNGQMTHTSQFFHFNVGWRAKLRETIEFASALIWSKDKKGEEVLVGLGVKDEFTGFCKIPIDFFEWDEYTDTLYYGWSYLEEPISVEELRTQGLAYHPIAPARQLKSSHDHA